METEDKEDITAEIHHQVSDAAREEQQSDNKERILPFDSTNQAETWIENVGEPLIKVKLEKVESEDCSSYSGETRHWVVCENGILKEVKLEQSHCVQGMCAGEDCNRDIVHEQNNCSRTDAKVSKTQFRQYVGSTCGESFTKSRRLTVHERIHAGLKGFICTTCGKSFAQNRCLKIHRQSHTHVTCAKSFSCTTCGKSFNKAGYLKRHKRHST